MLFGRNAAIVGAESRPIGDQARFDVGRRGPQLEFDVETSRTNFDDGVCANCLSGEFCWAVSNRIASKILAEKELSESARVPGDEVAEGVVVDAHGEDGVEGCDTLAFRARRKARGNVRASARVRPLSPATKPSTSTIDVRACSHRYQPQNTGDRPRGRASRRR